MQKPKRDIVFKIATRDAWNDAARSGAFAGSSDDVRDGYIHLSTYDQLAGTLAKHFAGKTHLVLVSFAAADLGDPLRWERSRNGDLFAHLYASLPAAAARSVWALALDERGLPIIPADAAQC